VTWLQATSGPGSASTTAFVVVGHCGHEQDARAGAPDSTLATRGEGLALAEGVLEVLELVSDSARPMGLPESCSPSVTAGAASKIRRILDLVASLAPPLPAAAA